MIIKVGEKLKVMDAPDSFKAWCDEYLVLDNPEYYKKEKMGKWVGNIPKTICLYEQVGNVFFLPFGCLRDMWRMYGNTANFGLEIIPFSRIKYESDIKPFAYQENAVQAAIKAKNGVLVMPCGSGKTQCGLEIIARLGGRALWLTHTQDLLNQSKDRAKATLGSAGLGTITAGKVKIGSHITFATVQTMCKLDLSQYRDAFDIVIVDECQHCCGSPTKVTQFYKVVSRLSARYKIGLTATPTRADGLERGMFALLGDVFYEVSRDEVRRNTCPVKVLQSETGYTPNYSCVLMSDGTIDYSKVIDDMIHNEGRYEVVFGETLICATNGPTIVLANRVEYLQRMNEDMIGCGKRSICLSGLGQSKKAKAERKDALLKLNSGELDCIFATYQLAKEGLDVPNLRYVVFATPEKNETTIIQSVGRVGRKAEGKEFGTVIDFVDDFGMYRGWAKKRKGYYRKIDAEII